MVVIPQGVRRVLPALMNQFISLIKDSSLVYFLGLLASQRELFAVGRDLNAQTGNLSPLVAAGLVYLLLTIPLERTKSYLISKLLPVGNYGLQPEWTDGHQTGLYTWAYLRELCPCPECRARAKDQSLYRPLGE